MRKQLLIFLFLLLISFFSTEAQPFIYKKIDMLNVDVKFEQIFDTILNFEQRSVYGGITDDRCYFVDYHVHYDTNITIHSLYSTDFFRYLSDSIYGMLMYRNHKIFLKHSIGDYVQKTDRYYSLRIDFAYKNYLHFDDSQTRWHFLLHNGLLKYQYVEGTSLEYMHGVEPIEIIEEPIEKFPQLIDEDTNK
jgi:hypothetical protein